LRRILVLLTVPILLALGIVAAPGASADTVNGGTLTSGSAVTGTVSGPDREIQYSFAGFDGVHDTLEVTASNWGGGAAQLGVYLPSGEAALFCPINSGPSFCEFTPHVTGTWKVRVIPENDATGSVTFKYATDQLGGALTPGIPSSATIGIKGQRAGFTFTGTRGVHNVIDVSDTNWGNGSANLNIYQPDGVYAMNCPLDITPTTCDFTPPVTGTWKAVIAPDEDSLGSATITLAVNPDRGTLTPGKPVTAAITIRGTTASYTFAALQGVRNIIDVSAADWGSGTAALHLYQPDGVASMICPIDASMPVCVFTPPISGTWKVEIASGDNSLGSTTMTLATDQTNGPLVAGAPTTTTIAIPGQFASYTFSATKGIKRTINISAANWGTEGSADLNIYQPDGVHAVICPMTEPICTFTPPVGGTWKAQIAPADNAVGNATMTLVSDQDRGTLTPGTAVITAIPVKGTTASYTFTGTKNVHSVLDVSATDWGTGSADLKIYLPSGDLGLSCRITSVSMLCPFIPRITGTWRVVVDPVSNSVGSVTMTLAADQNKGTLTPGTPVTSAFASRGWQISYTFAATVKQHMSLDVTATNWGTGGANLYVFQPNGVLAVICPLASAATFCDFSPPVGGTWRVAVVPTGNSVGSATMNLALDQQNGKLTPDTPVIATIATKGQRASYTFAGTSGTKSAIKVTASNWGAAGSATLDIYLPNGQVGLRCAISSTPSTCNFIPHSTGTWKAVLVPVGNSVGSATLTLS
jgi:hypothetical protein